MYYDLVLTSLISSIIYHSALSVFVLHFWLQMYNEDPLRGGTSNSHLAIVVFGLKNECFTSIIKLIVITPLLLKFNVSNIISFHHLNPCGHYDRHSHSFIFILSHFLILHIAMCLAKRSCFFIFYINCSNY